MDSRQVDKAELLRRIDRSFRTMDELLGRAMRNGGVEAPGVTEGWSVKDVVAHLIAHEQRTIEELRYAKRGEWLAIQHGENDSFNDGAVYACRVLPFEIVHEQRRRSVQLIIETIQALGEADFDPQGEVVKMLDDTIDGAVANNTYEHHDDHRAQIERWLTVLGR